MENVNSNIQDISSDQQSAHMVRQAIKDDQSLSAVAGDIHVTVKGGMITLDGQVSTEQQMNLATNTAAAIGMDDGINNRMVLKTDSSVTDGFRQYQEIKKAPLQKEPAQESEALARADDDGFAVQEKLRDISLLLPRSLSIPNLHSAVPRIFEDLSFRLVRRK